MGADCKSVGLRLQWFESTTCHQDVPMWSGVSLSGSFQQVVDDITSRGALAGAASAATIVFVVAWWWASSFGVRKRCRRCKHVILVTGSRGKSSMVRLLHAVLCQAGQLPYAKMTGTAAAEISPSGVEQPTHRLGQVSILEMFDAMKRALNGTPRANELVMECMAVSPDLIALIAEEMLEPDIVVITNAQWRSSGHVDHHSDPGDRRSCDLAHSGSGQLAAVMEFVRTDWAAGSRVPGRR